MYVFICTRTPCRYQNSWRSLIKNSAVFAYKPMHIFPYTLNFLSVQFSCSVVSNSATPWTRSTPGLPVHEFTQTHVHWVSDAIQPSHPLSSPSPPAFNLSQRQGFLKWVSIRWPKYWSFSFNISSSNEHPGLISSRMDWLDLLAVQGTLKSLLQHDSSKASILRRSAFFTVQLLHPYMTTGKRRRRGRVKR